MHIAVATESVSASGNDINSTASPQPSASVTCLEHMYNH